MDLATRVPHLRRTRLQPRWGRRGLIVGALLLGGLWAAAYLELTPGHLLPSGPGLRMAREFFGRALAPALEYEASFIPAGTPPLPLRALAAAGKTVTFATSAMSLALVLGLLLAFLASSAWWATR